jgi:hypothetical protein
VLLTKGDFTGPGGTNEMKILKVGEAGLEFGAPGA